jgi:hypothetical protein
MIDLNELITKWDAFFVNSATITLSWQQWGTLVARLSEQAAMLRRLEWAVDWSRFGIASNHCPVCGNERSHGHAPDCELAALLAAPPQTDGAGGDMSARGE